MSKSRSRYDEINEGGFQDIHDNNPKCAGCKQLIVDTCNIYHPFTFSSKPTLSKLPYCVKCSKKIYEVMIGKEVTEACQSCGLLISGDEINSVYGLPYCDICYDKVTNDTSLMD